MQSIAIKFKNLNKLQLYMPFIHTICMPSKRLRGKICGKV